MLKVKKADFICYMLTTLVSLLQGDVRKNLKSRWKSMKIANIDREILHIFWTTSGISVQVSRKMWIMIILKVTKKRVSASV